MNPFLDIKLIYNYLPPEANLRYQNLIPYHMYRVNLNLNKPKHINCHLDYVIFSLYIY